MKDDDFYLKVAYALSGCQLVEQELKLYICETFHIVKKQIDVSVPFNMDGMECENYPLERLIGTFKKLTNNSVLVSELNKFKDERNFLSHKGITHCLDYEGELFQSTAIDFSERLEKIQSDALRLRAEINSECRKLLVHSFDNLDNPEDGHLKVKSENAFGQGLMLNFFFFSLGVVITWLFGL